MWAKVASWIGVIIALVFSLIFWVGGLTQWLKLARQGAFTSGNTGAMLVFEIIVDFLVLLIIYWIAVVLMNKKMQRATAWRVVWWSAAVFAVIAVIGELLVG